MRNEHPYIPEEVVKGFARTPESFPKERKRRGRGYRPLRRALEPDEVRALFDAQGGRCYYCKLRFGTVVYRQGRPHTLVLTQDHRLPYSRYRNNSKELIVLACDVCNMFKANTTFKTELETRLYIRERFIRKGYSLAPPGIVEFSNASSILINRQFVYAVEGAESAQDDAFASTLGGHDAR